MKTSVSWIDGAYLATCEQFPHLSAHGATQQEALDELAIAIDGAIELYEANGWPLPETTSNKPAGWNADDQAELDGIRADMQQYNWSTPMMHWITRSRVALWFVPLFEQTDALLAERLRYRAQSLAAMEAMDEYE